MSVTIDLDSVDIEEVALYDDNSLDIEVYGSVCNHRINCMNSIGIESEGGKTVITIDKLDNVVIKDKDWNIVKEWTYKGEEKREGVE